MPATGWGGGASAAWVSHDRILRPSGGPRRFVGAMEFRSADDCSIRNPGVGGESRPLGRPASRLGRRHSAVRHLRLSALRAVIRAVLGAGVPPCPPGSRRGAAAGGGPSAETRRLTAALRAGRGACGHSLALARAGSLCLGPRHCASLLADAGLSARERLAYVAGDPDAGGAAGAGAGRARGDGRPDGPSRRADRVRVTTALYGAFHQHVALGAHPAR